MPVKTGIQVRFSSNPKPAWIPASAGMTDHARRLVWRRRSSRRCSMIFNKVFIICRLVGATDIDYRSEQRRAFRRFEIFMSKRLKMSRRGFLGAATALGTMALAGCGTRAATSSSLAASRSPGELPARGEFIVKNAHVLTMDPKLGEIHGGDIHVRDGVIVAVGQNLA